MKSGSCEKLAYMAVACNPSTSEAEMTGFPRPSQGDYQNQRVLGLQLDTHTHCTHTHPHTCGHAYTCYKGQSGVLKVGSSGRHHRCQVSFPMGVKRISSLADSTLRKTRTIFVIIALCSCLHWRGVVMMRFWTLMS